MSCPTDTRRVPRSAWRFVFVASQERGPFARGPAAGAWLRDARSVAMDLADGRPVTVGLIRKGISGLGAVQNYATERGDSDQLASCDERAKLLGFAIRSAGVLP